MTSEKMPKTKEEAVALADSLAQQYSDLDKVRKEISDHEYAIEHAPRYKIPTTRRPSEYMQKYIPLEIVIFILLVIVCIIVYFMISVQNFAADLRVDPSSRFSEPRFLVFLPPLAVGIMHFLLLKHEAKHCRGDNESAIREMEKNASHLQKMKDELIALHDKKNSLHAKLASYNDIVPSDMQQKSRMLMARDLLADGKAGSFEEAVEMCMKMMSKEK